MDNHMSSQELRSLQEYYISTFDKKKQELKSFIKAKDEKNIINFGHKLKGSGVSYGYENITKLGEKIENLRHDFSYEHAEIFLNEMNKIFSTIEKEFNQSS